MPYVRGIETAVPPHCIEQSQARSFAAGYFSDLPGIARLLPVFDHAGIERRYFSRPAEWFLENRSFAEKNQAHLEAATELGTRVAMQLLAATGEAASSIDAVFVVNSTGIATPSLDARLLFRLGLRPDVRRIPIWGLGCAGGVAGLAHAASYLEGRPNERVLLISLELCGLTFLAGDHSRSNLVACALFGEGAAAVLVDGDAFAARSRVRFLAAGSTHYPNSLDVMGWHVVEEGLQVVFAQRIPEIVRREARSHFQSFLAKQDRTLADVDHFLFHPGGVKVLQAYRDVLDVATSRLDRPRSVLQSYGNMSSVTVLFVLAEHLAGHAVQTGTESLGAARRDMGSLAAARKGMEFLGAPRRDTESLGAPRQGTESLAASRQGVALHSVSISENDHRDDGCKRVGAAGVSTTVAALASETSPPRWSGEPVAGSGQGIALLSALGPGFSSESLLLEIS